MTKTEEYLIGKGIRADNAARIVTILQEFWDNGNGNCQHYRNRLKEVTMRNDIIDQAEAKFCEEFAEFDNLFNTPRLKSSPAWPTVIKWLKYMRTTGLCAFCDHKLEVFDEGKRLFCRPCDKVFSVKRNRVIAGALAYVHDHYIEEEELPNE